MKSPLHTHTPLPQSPMCFRSKCLGSTKLRVWCFRRRTDGLICALITLAIVLLVCAFALPAVISEAMNVQVTQLLTFGSATDDAYSGWQTNTGADAPVIHYDLYMFDISNADKVVCNGAYDPSYRDPCPGEAPALVERGPYAYNKLYSRFDVTFSHGGDRVSYYEKTFYQWDEERAGPGLSEKDVATQLSVTSSFVKQLLEGQAAMLNGAPRASSSSSMSGLEAEVRAWSERASSALRHGKDKKNMGSSEGDSKATAAEAAEAEAAADAVLSFGNAVADSLHAFEELNGDGWRLLLKLLLCAAPPDGDSPFHSRSVHDLYWGYWDDPIMELIGAIVSLGGGSWITYMPGFANNYTSEADARHRTPGTTVVNTGGAGESTTHLHDYHTYEGMSDLYICLAPGVAGSEENHTASVCANFDSSWDEQEIENNGYVFPWSSPEDCPISGFSNGEGFEPFRDDATSMKRKIFISDISRSIKLEPDSTYEWRGITLTRQVLQLKDLQTANCSWAWPEDDPGACNPDNARYFSFGPSGLLNMSKLSGGVELFASKPHFLDGHPWLQAQFNGALHPDSSRHETYLDIEPLTGLPFRLAERLQISLKLDDWDLPQVPFSSYFGWSTHNEGDILDAALRAVYLAARDRAFEGIETRVEQKLGAVCAKARNTTNLFCKTVGQEIRNQTYTAVKKVCKRMHSSVVVPGSDGDGLTKVSVCGALKIAHDVVFSNRLILKVINTVMEKCEDDSTKAFNDCAGFYEEVHEEVQGFVTEKCADPKDNKVKALCVTGKFVFSNATQIFREVGRLCTMGVCEVVPSLLDGTVTQKINRIEGAEEKICAKSREFRTRACDTVSNIKNFLVHDLCGKIIFNKTVSTPIGTHEIVVNSSKICGVVRKLLFEDTIDDKTYDDDIISQYANISHGFFWKKMHSYCNCEDLKRTTKNLVCKTTRQPLCKAVVSATATYCKDNPEACAAVRYVADNWKHIDHTFLNVTARLERECGLGLCEDIGLVPGYYKELAEEAVANFCFNGSSPLANGSSSSLLALSEIPPDASTLQYMFSSRALARGERPFTEDETNSVAMRIVAALNRLGVYPEEFSTKHVDEIYFGGGQQDVKYPDGEWVTELMNLGQSCPTLSHTVEKAIEEFCHGDKDQESTCSVLKHIPWKNISWNTPVNANDGPILSYINSTVKPKLEELAADLKTWCGMSGVKKDWHRDACDAIREFARDELIRSFNMLVDVVADKYPQYDIKSAVTNTEEWLTCALGESEWPVPADGYYIPSVWTDEWMDVSTDDSTAFKTQVVQTQNTSDAIYVWCLVLSLMCFLFALTVAVSRRLTKLDYEASERLLPGELVASQFGLDEGMNYYALDGDIGASDLGPSTHSEPGDAQGEGMDAFDGVTTLSPLGGGMPSSASSNNDALLIRKGGAYNQKATKASGMQGLENTWV